MASDPFLVQDKIKVTDGGVFDTVTVPLGTLPSKIVMFQHTRAVHGVHITNLSTPGELPNPQRVLVQSITIEAVDATLADWKTFQNNFVYNFMMYNRPWTDYPVNQFPGAAGIPNHTSALNGIADIRARRVLQNPFAISSNVNFGGELNGPGTATLVAPVTFRVVYDGLVYNAML